MRMVIVAGTPGSGKTAVLIHSLKRLIEKGLKPSVVKIDCLYTDDDKKFAKIGVPTKVGLSLPSLSCLQCCRLHSGPGTCP